ncbi:MAG: hypothetical protein R3C68_14595 [Myxococcota bacterium]
MRGVGDCRCLPTPEACDDGLDNDCDGDIDAADTNCQGDTDVDVVCQKTISGESRGGAA